MLRENWERRGRRWESNSERSQDIPFKKIPRSATFHVWFSAWRWICFVQDFSAGSNRTRRTPLDSKVRRAMIRASRCQSKFSDQRGTKPPWNPPPICRSRSKGEKDLPQWTWGTFFLATSITGFLKYRQQIYLYNLHATYMHISWCLNKIW